MSTSDPAAYDPAASTDIPAADQPGAATEPETQGVDPLSAELGDDGQGDLAPEDLPEGAPDDPAMAAPQDLRDELPGQADVR